MTIDSAGFFDWMRRDLGPSDKTYSEPCTSEVVVFHDAVGYLPGWYSRLFSTARDAQGRYTPYAAASVTGWLPYKAGQPPVQHYSIRASCWASGSRHLNIHGNAFENESQTPFPADPYNPLPQSDWQVECAARIERDLAEHFGRPLNYWRRPTSAADVTATEYEHRETVRWGGAYSSCPNGRIRWADIAALRQPQEEDWMAGLSESARANIERFFGENIGPQRLFEELAGRFVKAPGSPTVYLLYIRGGYMSKHSVADPTTLFLLGGRWDSITAMTDAQAAKIPLGRAFPSLM